MRSLASIAVLFALWLLMSGIYKPLTIGFGLASAILAVLVVRRMDKIDGAVIDLRLRPVATVGYLVWLLWEIAKANWTVAKIILSPDMALNQKFIYVPYSQKTSLGKTTFANSITLTPGTISVEVEPEQFLVHAVAFSDGDMDSLADMDARVAALETGGPR